MLLVFAFLAAAPEAFAGHRNRRGSYRTAYYGSPYRYRSYSPYRYRSYSYNPSVTVHMATARIATIRMAITRMATVHIATDQ